MGVKMVKRDRTARLLRLQLILGQYSEGLEIHTLARLCSINVRTVYRDLKALETELNVPIWQEGKKRGIVEGYFLPPISFSLTEAITIFSCARLIYNHLRMCNPGIISTFLQLGSIMPPQLKKQMQKTIDHIEKLPRNENRVNNYNKLVNAWLSQHPVTILYQEFKEQEPKKLTINPYFIETNTTRHYNYIIGYSHSEKLILTFRMDRLVGDVSVDESRSFEIPADFDTDDYCDIGWGTYANEKTETVKLRFNLNISREIQETKWHSSQKTEVQSDGSTIMTLKAKNTVDFRKWILSFGCDVEILEPEDMRQQMCVYIKSLMHVYNMGTLQDNEPIAENSLSHFGSEKTGAEDKRKLDVNKIQLIRRKVLVEKLSIRSVSRQLDVSRNTIAKYIA